MTIFTSAIAHITHRNEAGHGLLCAYVGGLLYGLFVRRRINEGSSFTYLEVLSKLRYMAAGGAVVRQFSRFISFAGYDCIGTTIHSTVDFAGSSVLDGIGGAAYRMAKVNDLRDHVNRAFADAIDQGRRFRR